MTTKFWRLKKDAGNTIFAAGAPSEAKTAAKIDLAPGAVIGGTYQIIERIGEGGMGEVYLAKHKTLNKQCALKVIPPDKVTEIGWRRFQLEAKAVAKLDHINLIRVTDLGIHDGCLPFYSMDFVRGTNLASLLHNRGPMSLADTIAVFMQVCDGVEHAHRNGILHRDIKPANIMILNGPNATKLAKVLDFGLAKLTKHDREKQSLTSVGEVFGTPFYMSPEQCMGEKIDQRSDIYSIGCTMFECLTGRPPFVGMAVPVMVSHRENDPPTLEAAGAENIPPSMEIVMAKLLRKNPVERYQNLSQLRADLERVAAGQEVMPVYARRESVASGMIQSADKSRSFKGRPMLSAFVGVIGAVSILAVAGSYGYRWFQEQSHPRPKAASAKDLINTPKGLDEDMLNMANSTLGPKGDSIAPSTPAGTKYKGEPFYKGAKLINGQSYRLWELPPAIAEDVQLEQTAHGSQKSFGSRPETSATTTLEIPSTSTVCVNVMPELVQKPYYWKGFIDGGFDSLSMKYLTPADIEKILPHFAGFKCVKDLRLGNPEWKLEDQAVLVKAVNAFPNLEGVDIALPVEPKTLASFHCLNRLTHISFDHPQPDWHGSLLLLAAHPQIESLRVWVWTSDHNDYKLLLRFPNLKSVRLGDVPGTHDLFEVLAKLPKLEHLHMTLVKYRPDLLNDFRSLKNLKDLTMETAGYWPLTPKDVALALPRVSLRMFSKDTESVF